MEEIILQMEQYVISVGPWGPVAYVFMMIIAVVIAPVPSSPLAIFAGTVFGVWWGFLWTMVGSLVGSMIDFWIARRFGRPLVVKLVSEKKLSSIEKRFSEHNLIATVFILRLLPLPLFDAVSYAAGLTKISIRGFAGATFFGLIPLIFLFSYVGDLLTENLIAFTAGVIIFSVALFVSARIYYNYKNGTDESGESKNSLSKARNVKQKMKQENLDKILVLINEKGEVDNKDIKHLLNMSQTSATRYMDILEKMDKIEQVGDAGRGVFYKLRRL